MTASSGKETFRAVELGFGGSARVYDQGRFKLRLIAQLLAVPFSNYAVGELFRVNGYGYSAGGGTSATYLIGKNFGLEAYGGFYYTSLSGFSSPKPYSEISPTFMGTRLGLGLNYQF